MATLVKPLPKEDPTADDMYACGVCGQEWMEKAEDYFHGMIPVVVKKGEKPDAYGEKEVFQEFVRGQKGWEKEKARWWRVDPNILNFSSWLGCLAGLVVSLATMPPLSEGRSARYTWVLLGMFGGATLGAALGAFIDWLLEIDKRK